MKKGAMSFWDYLAAICLLGIVVWLLLKIFGVINTPSWLEYAPIYGVVYIAGWAMERLKRATDDVKDVKEDVDKLRVNCPILREK